MRALVRVGSGGLVVAVVSLVACTDAESRAPSASTDAAPPPSSSSRPDGSSSPAPQPAPEPLPARDAGSDPPTDSGIAIAPVPQDGGVPWDGAAPRDETPSLEPVDAGVRDEMDTAEPDPSIWRCHGPADCEADEFCFFPRAARCGAEDTPGRCVARPAPGTCSETARTVCGCDGHTYPNACTAWESGTDVAADGACP